MCSNGSKAGGKEPAAYHFFLSLAVRTNHRRPIANHLARAVPGTTAPSASGRIRGVHTVELHDTASSIVLTQIGKSGSGTVVQPVLPLSLSDGPECTFGGWTAVAVCE